ncbi:MAG: DUF192 domain-containing protein, partial [Planctomycetota bacterium]|nr:DUF192 domain-containing protein [Planctomycetota bacterium]
MAAQCVKRLALGLMLVVATFLTSCDGQGASGTETIVINGKSFVLEVASDLPAIEAGLSNRATIPDGTGMLFILPSSRKLKFWMKNCLTDIDIIYLDPNGRVTATHRMKAETPQGANETEKQYELRLTN